MRSTRVAKPPASHLPRLLAGGRRLRAQAEHEWQLLFVPVGRRLRARGWAAFPLALTLSAAVVALAFLNTVDHHLVGHWFNERARYRWPKRLMNLPGSMLAPAPPLPAWGSVLQVYIVVAAGELFLGWRRTLRVAFIGHALATLSCSLFIWLGPHVLFGLSPYYRHVLDTGPSAAMTAVAVYLAMTRRAPLLLALTSLGLFAELGVSLWDLAAREHIVAIAAGVACAAVTTARRRSRRARTPGAEHALADAAFSPW